MRKLLVGVAGMVVLVGVVWSLVPGVRRLLPGKQVTLAKRELPGAALLFPADKTAPEPLDYQAGRVEAELPAGGLAQLEWLTGEPLAPDALEAALVGPMRAKHDASITARADIVVAGQTGRRWLLGGKRINMALSIWPCGKRHFSLTVAAHGDITALDGRIRDSFECKPDPALDGKRRSIDVELDLGPDFGLGSENPLTVVSLDGDVVVVVPYAQNLPPDARSSDQVSPGVMDAVAASAGVTGTSFKAMTVSHAGADRHMWSATGDMGGARKRLVSALVNCGATKYLALHLGDPSTPESRARELVLGARCAKNPKRPPPFEQVARALRNTQ
jgi:hypothetical protein